MNQVAQAEAETFDFSLRGTAGLAAHLPNDIPPYVFVTPEVTVEGILKLRVTARPGSPIGLGSSFTANYNCVQFRIKVGNTIRTTSFLRTGNGPFPANSPCNLTTPEAEVQEFSSLLSGEKERVSIEAVGARYDFYCSMLNSYMTPFSPWDPWAVTNYCTYLHPVWHTHQVNGTLEVITSAE